MENEIWKPIPGYEGVYEVSNFGKVKSLKYNKERILKPSTNGQGYYKVNLYINGAKKYTIHRLVWIVFNGMIPKEYEINHKDEDKSNNRLDNLELVTRKQNNNYGTRTERAAKHFRKPILQFDLKGNFIQEFQSVKEAEKLFGGSIGQCLIGKCKTTYSYIWKYK